MTPLRADRPIPAAAGAKERVLGASELLLGLKKGARARDDAARRAALEQGRAIERALAGARLFGGFAAGVIGPFVTPNVGAPIIVALGAYFALYGIAVFWLSDRVRTAREHQLLRLGSHALDTIGVVVGLAVSAADPQWMAVIAMPLYVVLAAARFGTFGAYSAAAIVSVWFVILSLIRERSLGVGFDLAHVALTVALFVLGAVVMSAIHREVLLLRARSERQDEVYDPLLRALNDLRLGVLVSEEGRPLYASEAFVAMTGYARDELGAMASTYELLPEEDRARTEDKMREIPEAGAIVEKTLVKKDGGRIETEVALRRYRVAGRQRAVALIRDLSQRKQAYRELQQYQRLDSIGQLAGGIAHDFNNLLAVILNHARFVLADLPSGDPRRGEVQEILRTAERGAALTRQLLIFGSRDLAQPQVLRLAEAVRDAGEMLRRTIGAGITLEVSIAEDLRSIRIDPSQLEQVLVNVAANARDAMPGGGSLAIIGENADVDDVYARQVGVEPGAYVRVAVSDTGSGMTGDIAARAFEPFFTTKPRGKGSGLGLSTVYGIVKQSGGHTFLRSLPGQGTTVVMLLPTVETEALPRDVAGLPRSAVGNGETVLVLEDEEALRPVVRRILERHGYTVLEAGTPGTALDVSERHQGQIHLLLADMVLPEMSGREVAAQLRARRPEMRVLYTSGYPNEVLEPGTGWVDADLIPKPFTEDELVARVSAVLEQGTGGERRQAVGAAG